MQNARKVSPVEMRSFFRYAPKFFVSITFRLATSIVPDCELDLISKLYNPDDRLVSQGKSLSHEEKLKRSERLLEFLQEDQRLQSLVMSDAAWNESEAMDSFVSFLRTLNPSGRDYWPNVYRRIGLPCPLPNAGTNSIPDRQAKNSWWHRLFR